MFAIEAPAFIRPEPRKIAWALIGSVLLHAALLVSLPPLVQEAGQALPKLLQVRLVDVPPKMAQADPAPAPKRAEKASPSASPAAVIPKPATSVAAMPSAPDPVVSAPATPVISAPQPSAVPEAPVYVPPDVRAAYLANPRPAYPLAARRLGLEGRVVLRAEILENGSCGRIAIAEGSGNEMLDQAAMRAVKQWRFVPARRGGEAVPAWAEIPISFKLATDS